MGITQWWIVDVIGAALLGLVLLWAVLKGRNRTKQLDDRAERGTHNLYEAEEQRRRDGTDGL